MISFLRADIVITHSSIFDRIPFQLAYISSHLCYFNFDFTRFFTMLQAFFAVLGSATESIAIKTVIIITEKITPLTIKLK